MKTYLYRYVNKEDGAAISGRPSAGRRDLGRLRHAPR